MDYLLPRNSGKVLLPVRLSLRSGEKLAGLLPGVDAASALVIAEAADGSVDQEFHPLNLRDGTASVSGDSEWSLRGFRAGSRAWAYFLEMPATIPAGAATPRSLSIQIVGHSAFRENASFAGHVSLAFGPNSDAVPFRFARLVDTWFPVLLPEYFTAGTTLDRMDEGEGALVLTVTLARRSGANLPPSLRAEWDPSGWNGSVLEPVGSGADSPGYFTVRGGCFLSPEGKISHWFGGGIGLNRRGFREKASAQLLPRAPRGEASWCFWIEPLNRGAPLSGLPAGARFRIRHPSLGLAWNGLTESPRNGNGDYRRAMDMLRHAARLWTLRLAEWEKIHLGESGSGIAETLGTEARSFYARHGSVLSRLAVFQATRPLSGLQESPLAEVAAFATGTRRGQEAR